MPLRIFPYSLVRYAGMDYRNFGSFILKNPDAVLEQYLNLFTSKQQQKDRLCEYLYQHIADTDDTHRQSLIDLKRRIFNDREISGQKLLRLEPALPSALWTALEKYLQLQRTLNSFLTDGAANYKQKLEQDRVKLQELAKDPVLQNGLLLSSPVLLEQLPGYLRKKPVTFRQKELRIEFSLLRYLTRSCFKTSPFSTFTHTGIMQLSDNDEYRAQPEPKTVQSNLRLNNYLFAYLNSILLHHPELNELLLIRLNKTVAIQNDKIQFLVNFNNIESFQQIPASGLPMIIVDYLQESETSVTLQGFTDRLTEIVQSAGRSDIKAFLLKLVTIGLLEAGTGISGIDPDWDTKTGDFLDKTGNNTVPLNTLKNLFRELRACRLNYPKAGTGTRRTLLKTAEARINETFKELEENGGIVSTEEKPAQDPGSSFEKNRFASYRFSQKQLFYEDCHTPEKEIIFKDPVQKLVEKTDELLNLLLPLDLMRKERIKMAGFFTDHYPGEETVNIMDFYKSYYLLVKKPEKELAEKGKSIRTEETLWEKALAKRIAGITKNKPEILELRKDLFDNLPIPEQTRQEKQYSRGMFIQLYTDKEKDNGDLFGVINMVLPGMGKVSGRFLSLFDKKVTAGFVNYNNRLYPRVIKAELNDASGFNANIHPPLLSYEVALPGGNNIYPAEKQIQINDLYVRLNKNTGFPELLKDGKPVFTYDLCLESFYNRSNLYQMMAHFNPEAKFSLKSLIRLADITYMADKNKDCYILPRITYEKNIIIRRKTWCVSVSSIPKQEQGETDFTYYLKFNAWRQANGIPGQVFLFIRKRTIGTGQPPQKKTAGENRATDDYKPQYIAFGQPVLMEMFKRLIGRAGSHISLEEVLPTLPENHSDPDMRVKEYLIQWYKY
ncbi:hypothetical protein ED312_18545 [Sinomicrobium pectinilyticum]|uniref:Lantibiotic dehydratase N-terminal domain-containing protein n=1 Tax=Sinomicrobium pectinilyticum TaxID=1084421 RepID=A0A3N0E1M1_SINP1|nr:lantibiotic dehydratase [Sinomicrobium pectinilyticum]RNL81731.1 hypothetical protein ED312_18545 [Sinomicrobium pectinilyticum]